MISKSVPSPINILHPGHDNNSLTMKEQNETMLVLTSGHFTDNQMENGIVT